MNTVKTRWALAGVVFSFAMGFLQTESISYAETPATGKHLRNIPYRADDGTLDAAARERCQVDLFIPAGMTGFPTVVWFHGGGLTGGNREIPQAMMNQGVGIVSASYRLAPKVPVTTCLEDAAAAAAWTIQHIHEYGGSPDKVFLAGNSAGGYQVLMLGLDHKWLAAHDLSPDRFAGIVSVSGQAITHMAARAEQKIPPKQPLIDELAPLYHVRKDVPPLLLITGDRELEIYGRYDENAYLARMFKIMGNPDVKLIEIPGTNHGTMFPPAIPHLFSFVKAQTGSP
ncbi:MAG TPA: alpha/beta hydrolase fold domain-containing protein [Planctomicrobium sp.]|nr:alpha/beta hydrolase fold domain-containing protein [Planctomicrobium sp.]